MASTDGFFRARRISLGRGKRRGPVSTKKGGNTNFASLSTGKLIAGKESWKTSARLSNGNRFLKVGVSKILSKGKFLFLSNHRGGEGARFS